MADQAAHLKEIARTMWRFRADGFLCDTVLYADDGQQIKAHSIVLAAASPIFRDALGVDSAERAEPHMIQLPGCDIATLEIALGVIYTGSLENSEGESAEMLQKVFLLLQQLGVELDRIDGCSVTYIDRQPHGAGSTVKVKIEDKATRDKRSVSVKSEYKEIHKTSPDDSVVRSSEAVAEETVVESGTVIPSVLSNTDLDDMGIIIEKSEADGEVYVIVGGTDEQGTESSQMEEGEMMSTGLSDEDTSEEKQVNCPECGRAFSKIGFLQVHLRSHTGEKPFECDRCGRSFSQRANLHRHYQGHIGEKPHLCHLCGRSFVHKVQLSEHMAHEHAGVTVTGKRYTCRICHLAFAERGHLRQHAVKIHPEEHREAIGAISDADRTHVCDTCGRGYTTLGALRMHMRIHTGDVMQCSFCDKTYVNRALLEQHLRTHTREKAFECRQCGKAFIYKNALTVHMRTHTGEKPYVCPICHNSYSQFGHLQSHKKTHTGERPYQCSACGKSYRQRVDLRLHLKRVHHDSSPASIILKKPVPQLVIEPDDSMEDSTADRSELILDEGTVE